MEFLRRIPHEKLPESKILDFSADDMNVYLNTRISNNTDVPSLATFNAELTKPILKHSSSYCMAVERLIVPTNGVPLFNFVDNTYTVTLRQASSGTDQQETVIYVPESNPIPPLQGIRALSQFAQLISTALQTAYTNLVAAVGPLPPGAPTTAPVLLWNEAQQKFYLHLEDAYADTNADRFEIYFNYALWSRMRAFRTFYNDFGTYTNGKMARIIIEDNFQTQSSAANFLDVYQWYNGFRWCFDLETIVLVANDLAIDTEQIGVNNSTSGSVIASITDFFTNIPGQGIFDQVSWTVYSPPLHRWIDMTSDSPTTRISYSIYWQDVRGNLFPIYLNAGDYSSCKFLFRKREFIT